MADSSFADIVFHYDGTVENRRGRLKYVGGLHETLYNKDPDYFSMWSFDDLLESVGVSGYREWFYHVPNRRHRGDTGLKPLKGDAEVLDIFASLPIERELRVVHLYAKHDPITVNPIQTIHPIEEEDDDHKDFSGVEEEMDVVGMTSSTCSAKDGGDASKTKGKPKSHDGVVGKTRGRQSVYPSFTITLCTSAFNPKGYLRIPSSFAKVYLKKNTSLDLKVPNGKSWTINSKTYETNHRYFRTQFVGGWPKFARDNGLRVGDKCTFELVEGAELCMKVTAFR